MNSTKDDLIQIIKDGRGTYSLTDFKQVSSKFCKIILVMKVQSQKGRYEFVDDLLQHIHSQQIQN